MCGICFVCGFSEDIIEELISSNQDFISHRGPDCSQRTNINIDELKVAFQGSVLWLQGEEPTPQPVLDQHGNILLWNGDVLAGYEIPEGVSDTKHVSDLLASKDEAEIISIFSGIKGPWSFVYYRQNTNRLYFGRDVFGRHSLLWQLPCDTREVFMITSVGHRKKSVQEIPALGIYYVDLHSSKLKPNFSVNLIPWSHVTEESLDNVGHFMQVENRRLTSPVAQALNTRVPDDDTLESLKSLPCTLGKTDTEQFYSAMKTQIDDLLKMLKSSIQRRVDKCPPKCQRCTRSASECEHSKVAVLFSGGLDSAVIALLLDSCLDGSESIDLLNVAFAKKCEKNATCGNSKKNKNSPDTVPEILCDKLVDYEVPDRISGRECWQELTEIKPHRKWNFVEINVTAEELARERESTISHLVAPLDSVLDDSIGCALWFGGRGQGWLSGTPYTCPARVLLCGMGADEQLGGYARHRGRFNNGGWSALLEEIDMEISRIHSRNLGRDNRILADHGRAPRFPYLDEDVVSTLNALPIWMKANLNMPRGIGEKLILRVAASCQGLTSAAGLPKRAIQFGSRIAKLENSKEKGSDSCHRLLEKTSRENS